MATVRDPAIIEREIATLKEEIETLQRDHPGDTFPDEVKERWNTKNRMLDELVKDLELAKRERRLEEIGSFGRSEGATERSASFQIRDSAWRTDPYELSTIERSYDPDKEGRQFKDRARFVIEQDFEAKHPKVGREETKEWMTRLVEDADTSDGKIARHMLANGSKDYARAFGKYLAGGFLTAEEQHALEISRAMSLTSAAGGYAVPVQLDPTIIPTSSYTINPFRAISRVIPVTVDTWNGVTSGAATAYFGAEATPTTDSSPTLGQVVVSTERGSAFIPFSIEIDQDWGSLQTEMGRLLGEAKDTLEATKFTTGTGTNEPYGLITGATTVYTAASTTALAVTDLYNAELALPARFRRNASMLFQRAVAQTIRGFDAGASAGSGSRIWIDNLRQGVSNNAVGAVNTGYNANVLGYPAYESVDMDSAFTTGKKLIVLGDFQYYIICDRIGMTIETIPHLFDVTNNQPTGQRGLYAYWRCGAKVANAASFVTLKLA